MKKFFKSDQEGLYHVQNSTKFYKLDGNKFKAYSFRIGAATQAHPQGFLDSQIRIMGRWHSESFQRSIHHSVNVSNIIVSATLMFLDICYIRSSNSG